MAGHDTVFGDAGDDVIAWNDAVGDTVFGGAGNDHIIGSDAAADISHGGTGDDLIQAFTTTATAATGADQLFGDAGNDVIIGGNASDRIEGGIGSDTLTGNGGADHFVFHALESGQDTIPDFSANQDVIDLLGFGAHFDPLAHLSDSSVGAVLDLGHGNQILFEGVHAADLSASDFVLK
jgi:Ca2+-binding RTX toxin-like protein